MTHATTMPLKRGESGDAIKVPLVQGESDRADRNKVIGVLCIHAHHIARDLPAGTEIEVTLSVDEFSRTEARGYVPLLDRWFDEIVKFEAEEKSAEQVNRGLSEQQERLKLLEKQAAELEAGGSGAASAHVERVSRSRVADRRGRPRLGRARRPDGPAHDPPDRQGRGGDSDRGRSHRV